MTEPTTAPRQAYTPKGNVRAIPVPPVPPERADALARMTPQDRAAVYQIAADRMRYGRGPSVRTLWRLVWPDRPIPPEGAYAVLLHLRQFGVYWKPNIEGSVWLQRSVYEHLRPTIQAILTAIGEYPRRNPYRGAKGPAQ